MHANAVLPGHDAEAIVFDSKEPAGADWRLQRKDRLGGEDESRRGAARRSGPARRGTHQHGRFLAVWPAPLKCGGLAQDDGCFARLRTVGKGRTKRVPESVRAFLSLRRTRQTTPSRVQTTWAASAALSFARGSSVHARPSTACSELLRQTGSRWLANASATFPSRGERCPRR